MKDMAASRATSPIDEGTFEGRLRSARLSSPYTAQQLAEALGLASGQSLYDWENPKTAASPNPIKLGRFAELTGRSLSWLVYGYADAAEDSPFVQQMRAFDAELDPRGRFVVTRTALAEVEEARKRSASGLSETELEMVSLMRSATPEALRLILATARSASGALGRGENEPHQEDANHGERSV